MDEYLVKEIIILCNILDKYSLFRDKINDIKKHRSSTKLLYKLEMIVNDKSCFGNKKIKKFYQENKEIIDMYYRNGLLYLIFDIEHLDTVYNHIIKNRDKLDKILALLNRLLELGVKEIFFNESYVYTDECYEMDNYMPEQTSIVYLDNIEILPSFDEYIIRYTTNHSNYRILLNTYNLTKVIELNDLTFDASRLPDKLTNEELFNRMLSLSKRSTEISTLEDIINMYNGTDILTHSMNNTMEMFKCINDSKSKEELMQLLTSIRVNVLKIQTITKQYEENTISGSDVLTKERIIQARRLCKEIDS